MPVSSPVPERPVLLLTRDLFFRAKLDGLIRAAGRTPVSQGAADLAVIELADAASVKRVRELVAGGTAVLAFGVHVRPELLRAARAVGAEAVANAAIEARLRQRLAAGA